MDVGVLELILFFVVEDDAVLIYKIQNSDAPLRRAEELDEQVVLPFVVFLFVLLGLLGFLLLLSE